MANKRKRNRIVTPSRRRARENRIAAVLLVTLGIPAAGLIGWAAGQAYIAGF